MPVNKALGVTMKCIRLAIVILVLSGCSHLGVGRFSDKSVVGKTVSRALVHLELDMDEYFVIQEPPGVPRGIYGKDKYGHIITLFIKRGDVPFSEKMDWKPEAFLEKNVIGIVRETDSDQYSYGDMPFDFRR